LELNPVEEKIETSKSPAYPLGFSSFIFSSVFASFGFSLTFSNAYREEIIICEVEMDKKKRVGKSQNKKQGAWEEKTLNQAQDLQSAGLPMEKKWLSVGDKSVGNKPAACGICLANDNVGWIPIDDAFPSGHMHPLAHTGCRCCLLTQWAQDGRQE